MRWLALPLAVLLTAACFSGCSGSTGGDQGSSSNRTATCLEWQDAMCDYLADRCQQMTRAECDDTFQSMFCKDDATMKACTAALASAACDPLPAACKSVADPQPAIDWCESFVDVYCTRFEACKMGTKASCISASASALDCSLAVGIGPTADDCMAALPKTPCDQMDHTPASCKGVVKLNQ